MGRSKEQVAEIILAWKRAGLPLPMCWEADVSHSLSCAGMHLEHREMSHRCHTQLANPSPKSSSLYQIPNAKIKEELQTLQHHLCFKLINF